MIQKKNKTKKETTIKDLVKIVERGFKENDKKVEKVLKDIAATVDLKDLKKIDKKIDELGKELSTMHRRIKERLLVIERDICDIRSHFIYREEFEDLMARVKYLETKAGIDSGK